jgi:hypothetical protein
MKPIIYLYNTESPGLIILYKTGVLISTQTGGYNCYTSYEEGIYVPLGRDNSKLVHKLSVSV